MASVSLIKLSKLKKAITIIWSLQNSILIFICMDKTKLEEVFISVPKKQKLLDEISKAQHDQGCITKKVKLNEENTDFILTDFTAIAKSKYDNGLR